MKTIVLVAVLASSGVAEAQVGAGDKQSRDLAYGPRKPTAPPVELYADILMEMPGLREVKTHTSETSP